MKSKNILRIASPKICLCAFLRIGIIRERHPGAQSLDLEIAENLHNLAIVYHDQGHLAEAGAFYHQAFAIRKRVLGLQYSATQETLTRYVILLHTMHQENEAITLESLLQR